MHPALGGMLNIFRLFILRSIYILSEDGIFSEIFPLAYTGDRSVANLRKYILDNCATLAIEAFPERDNPKKRVFESVKMSVCILILRKTITNNQFFVRINRDRFVDEVAEKSYLNKNMITTIDKRYLTIPLTSEKETKLLTKVFSKTQRFYDIGKCNTGEIDMTFFKSCFTPDSRKAKLYKGAIIDRYVLRDTMSQGEIVFLDEKKLSKIRSSINSSLKSTERIVLQGITGVNEKTRLKMMIVNNGYCANSLNYLQLNQDISLKYLLGIFNSKLPNFVFSKFSTNSNVNGYEIDNLPVPNNITQEEQTPVIELVAQILDFTKDEDYLENPQKQANVQALERKIDQLVYQLYGLTEEERRIVEEEK